MTATYFRNVGRLLDALGCLFRVPLGPATKYVYLLALAELPLAAIHDGCDTAMVEEYSLPSPARLQTLAKACQHRPHTVPDARAVVQRTLPLLADYEDYKVWQWELSVGRCSSWGKGPRYREN